MKGDRIFHLHRGRSILNRLEPSFPRREREKVREITKEKYFYKQKNIPPPPPLAPTPKRRRYNWFQESCPIHSRSSFHLSVREDWQGEGRKFILRYRIWGTCWYVLCRAVSCYCDAVLCCDVVCCIVSSRSHCLRRQGKGSGSGGGTYESFPQLDKDILTLNVVVRIVPTVRQEWCDLWDEGDGDREYFLHIFDGDREILGN